MVTDPTSADTAPETLRAVRAHAVTGDRTEADGTDAVRTRR